MRLISVSKMCGESLHIEGVRAVAQKWEDRTYSFLKTPRPDQGLCLILKGRATYRIKYDGGEEYFEAREGDLLYLPRGSRYSVHFYSDSGPERNLLLNFNAFDRAMNEVALSARVACIARLGENMPAGFRDTFERAVRVCREDSRQGSSARKAAAYSVFAEMESLELFEEPIPQSRGLISPGLEYLESHLTEKLSVPCLASKCHISETYFRRLFKAYTGMSPVTYRKHLLSEKAGRLLALGTMSLKEIADELGFCDTAHFCKSFKEATGFTPKSFLHKDT